VYQESLDKTTGSFQTPCGARFPLNAPTLIERRQKLTSGNPIFIDIKRGNTDFNQPLEYGKVRPRKKKRCWPELL